MLKKVGTTSEFSSKRTKAGFGGQFGTWIGKWDMYTLMPTKERDGQEGFVFTELVPDDYVPEFEIGMSEKDFDKKALSCNKLV